MSGPRRNLMHVLLAMDVGGAEMLVYEWMRRLDPERYASQVCCLRSLGQLGRRLIEQGYRVHDLASPPGFKMATIRNLRRILDENRVDIIHAHTYSPFVYSALARRRRTKLIFTEHGRLYPEVRKTKRRLVNPWLARRADHIVTISAATKRAMVEVDRLPEGRIQVIWNGVALPDPNRVTPLSRTDLGLPPEARIVGMASRVVALKDIPTTLRAFAQLWREIPDLYLVIAGDGDARADVERHCAELGISDRVRLLGMRDDLERLIPAFDLFASSSLTEGISLTLLQAMAHELPVVVTAVGGNLEVIQDGKSGLLVPPGDASAMAEAMRRVLGSQAFGRELGREAAARVGRHFTFEAMLDRYVELYES